MSTYTVAHTVTLKTTNCYRCGVTFGMPESLYNDRLGDKTNFYCPNGHSQHFLGKTHEQEKAELRDRVARERALRDQAEASARAQKAVATKARKKLARVSAGVCPECNRSFQNLGRHMKTKHGGHS